MSRNGKRRNKKTQRKAKSIRRINKITVSLIIICLFVIYPAKISAGIKHNKNIARHAISHSFCGNNRAYHLCGLGRQALNVSDCETGGTFNVYAGYGKHEYWGLFQMGAGERKKFGFAFNAWAQVRSAKKYFNYSVQVYGYGWHPWDCLPY